MLLSPLLLLCACACIVQAQPHVTLYEQGDGSPINIGYKWFYIFPPNCVFNVNIPTSLCLGSGLGGYVRAVKAELTDTSLAAMDLSGDLSSLTVRRRDGSQDSGCDSRAVLYLWANCSDTPIQPAKKE